MWLKHQHHMSFEVTINSAQHNVSFFPNLGSNYIENMDLTSSADQFNKLSNTASCQNIFSGVSHVCTKIFISDIIALA